jgi:glycosyltransferase involved in cell wall biosynthesis
MQIAFVQTYPIYHDHVDTETWLQRRNRVRWIPGILSRMGHDVELWAADRSASVHQSTIEGLENYPIRFFESVTASRKTKKHYSDTLVEHARNFDADIHVLKGTDGGVGKRLLRKFVLPEDRTFVFIIAGEYYTDHVPQADLVFYETKEQRKMLRDPGWYFWRTAVPDDRLLHMPKSVDTDQFRPMPEVQEEWDIVSVGRLIPRYKNYDALGQLSEKLDVAVVGGGGAKDNLESSHPEVDWLGPVSHSEVPEMMNRGRAFMHTSHRDYSPRVITEAAACGTPILAFAHAIAPDVLPPGCGLRLDQQHYVAEIEMLLDDNSLIEEMGTRAREYAVESLGKRSTQEPIERMIRTLSATGREHSS